MTTNQSDTGSRTLTEEECWTLLRVNVVGRVGFDMGHGIRIHPVNYAVDDRSILLRTAPDTELSRCVDLFSDGALVAFQVDDVDLDRHRGWSVLAQGGIGTVDAAEAEHLTSQWSPHPWAAEEKPLLLRIVPVQVTGRVVGRGWTRTIT
jgi:nitroimidazol reductase NimA-like FMN-containing flavoprotein (pyridoxamine 5'-phosphate oxidase superfamily)